jgi:hypothetical protein
MVLLLVLLKLCNNACVDTLLALYCVFTARSSAMQKFLFTYTVTKRAFVTANTAEEAYEVAKHDDGIWDEIDADSMGCEVQDANGGYSEVCIDCDETFGNG